MRERVPVLIVGGGSVGLATAAFLAHHGIGAVVLERRAELSNHPRATAIGPRAWEGLLELGLRADVMAIAERRHRTRGVLEARTIAEADVERARAKPSHASTFVDPIREFSPTANIGGLGQNQLDPLLARVAAEGGARFEWLTEMVTIEQAGDTVHVTARHRTTGATSEYEASWVIAADGDHSAVRPALGIGVTGPASLGCDRINVVFRADLSVLLPGEGFVFVRVSHPEAAGMLHSMDGSEDLWSFHIDVPEGVDDLSAAYPVQRCIDIIRIALGSPGHDIEVLSAIPWRPTGRLADRMQDGRVLLVGDVAHTMPPTGGFGLTTGVCDAHNLAWKIAWNLTGRAGDGLVDSYAQEREPRGRFVRDQAVLRHHHPEVHWNAEDVDGRTRLGIAAHSVAHISEHYRSGAVVDPRLEPISFEDIAANIDGSPGTRVPHAWVTLDGDRVSTLDLPGTGFAVLAGPDGQAWVEAAHAAAQELDVPVGGYLVGPDGTAVDEEGRFADLAQIGPDGALLVRPDGIVAWRAKTVGGRPADVLTDVLATVLDRR